MARSILLFAVTAHLIVTVSAPPVEGSLRNHLGELSIFIFLIPSLRCDPFILQKLHFFLIKLWLFLDLKHDSLMFLPWYPLL